MMTAQTSKEKKITPVAVSLALPLMLTYPHDSTVVMRYNSHMQTRQEVTKNVNISIKFRFWYTVGPITHHTLHTNYYIFKLSTWPGVLLTNDMHL